MPTQRASWRDSGLCPASSLHLRSLSLVPVLLCFSVRLSVSVSLFFISPHRMFFYVSCQLALCRTQGHHIFQAGLKVLSPPNTFLMLEGPLDFLSTIPICLVPISQLIKCITMKSYMNSLMLLNESIFFILARIRDTVAYIWETCHWFWFQALFGSLCGFGACCPAPYSLL